MHKEGHFIGIISNYTINVPLLCKVTCTLKQSKTTALLTNFILYKKNTALSPQNQHQNEVTLPCGDVQVPKQFLQCKFAPHFLRTSLCVKDE